MGRSLREQIGIVWGSAHLLFYTSTIILFRDYLTPGLSVGELLSLGVIFAACELIRKPGSSTRFSILALLQISHSLTLLPALPNHRLLALCINIAWLLSRFSLNRDSTFLHSVRYSLIVMYLWAAFAKLNSTFIQSATSCAATFYEEISILLPLPLLSTGATPILSVAVILIEVLIGISLLSYRTARWGSLLGILFHSFLVFDLGRHFVDFSAVMCALLYLASLSYFKPEEARKLRTSNLSEITLILFFLFAALGLVAVENWWAHGALLFIRLGLYFCFVLYLLRALMRLRMHRTAALDLKLSLASPLILCVFGALPYLGIRGGGALTMYSNLNLEPNVSNHYVVPVSLDLLGYQRDRVEIIGSSDSALQALADQGTALPWVEFSRRVNLLMPEFVAYRRGGVNSTFEGRKDEPLAELSWPLSWLVYFNPGASTECVW